MKKYLPIITFVLSVILLIVIIVKVTNKEEPETITKIIYVEVIKEVTPTALHIQVSTPTKPKITWAYPTVTAKPPEPTPWKYTVRRHVNTVKPTPTAKHIAQSGMSKHTLQIQQFEKYIEEWKSLNPGETVHRSVLWNQQFNPRPTKTPRPTYENPWIDTFKRFGGWCYLTRTNNKTGEVRKIPRRETVFWDYHNNGIETQYSIECNVVNGKEHCNSTMPPKMFNEWYNKFGMNIENQALKDRKGCT